MFYKLVSCALAVKMLLLLLFSKPSVDIILSREN